LRTALRLPPLLDYWWPSQPALAPDKQRHDEEGSHRNTDPKTACFRLNAEEKRRRRSQRNDDRQNAPNEVCPLRPGQLMTAHWGIPDPAAVQEMPEEIEHAFSQAFTMLDRRISLFLCLPLATLDTFSLQKEIDNIGKR
jgi:hypothetical protein